jgi:integrase
MVLCASMTSMNIAEIAGLRWTRLNLTAEPTITDGESIPGYHAAVRGQWYRGEFGTVKAKARRRNLPLPSLLVDALSGLRSSTLSAPDEFVFAGRGGRPVDAGAMLKRQVRKAASAIGVPSLGWHDLRRTFATLADQLGMTMGERQALMGHSRAAMTMQYTHTPTEQARAALEQLAEKVKGPIN